MDEKDIQAKSTELIDAMNSIHAKNAGAEHSVEAERELISLQGQLNDIQNNCAHSLTLEKTSKASSKYPNYVIKVKVCCHCKKDLALIDIKESHQK